MKDYLLSDNGPWRTTNGLVRGFFGGGGLGFRSVRGRDGRVGRAEIPLTVGLRFSSPKFVKAGRLTSVIFPFYISFSLAVV